MNESNDHELEKLLTTLRTAQPSAAHINQWKQTIAGEQRKSARVISIVRWQYFSQLAAACFLGVAITALAFVYREVKFHQTIDADAKNSDVNATVSYVYVNQE